MKKAISVVGGDLRVVRLVEMLIDDGYKVYTYGLEMSEELLNLDVEMCSTVEETVSKSKVVVGPIPLSSDRKNVSMPFSKVKLSLDDFLKVLKGKNLIAGNILESFKDELDKEKMPFIDLLKREEFAVLNAIATAEGTIQIIMEETGRTIHGSKVLVLGFGRIGKVLSKMLDGIGAKVSCEARKDEDLAWAKAYGFDPIDLDDLNGRLGDYEIIINTIPFQILNSERLELVKKDVILVDLASNPGGVDRKVAREKNLKLIWALSLPGKVAPVTSAEYIKEVLYHVLEEI